MRLYQEAHDLITCHLYQLKPISTDETGNEKNNGRLNLLLQPFYNVISLDHNQIKIVQN